MTISSVFSEMGRLIDQVSKDRGIERQIVVNAIVSGLLSAARKKFGTYRDIEAKFNEETGKLELYEFKEVVTDEKFIDEQIEIKLTEALKMDPEAQIGDQIGVALEPEDLGRIDAHTARQVVAQSLQSAENEVVFNEFEKRKGEIVSGVVRRVERGMIVVDMDRTEAYIPRREQIYGEQYNPGDRIQGYILEVRQTTRGPQIIMSRAHSNYLIKLFEKEVPEIYEGIVKIVSAAREPGQRAKIAVYSNDSAVHPVGSCVGMKGSRVQNITQELKGERIDVIVWEDDPVQFVCNALAPAKISKVLVDEENKEMEVIVSDDQLSLAIGKKGQNVQLAVKLTEWRLNIVSLTEFEDKKRKSIFNLKLLSDVTEPMLENIYQCGVTSVQGLADSSLDTIMNIPGYESQPQAEKLIQKAKDLVAEYKEAGKEFPKAPELQKKTRIPVGDIKAQADQQLKEELAQLSDADKSSSSLDPVVDSQSADAQAVTETAVSKEESCFRRYERNYFNSQSRNQRRTCFRRHERDCFNSQSRNQRRTCFRRHERNYFNSQSRNQRRTCFRRHERNYFNSQSRNQRRTCFRRYERDCFNSQSRNQRRTCFRRHERNYFNSQSRNQRRTCFRRHERNYFNSQSRNQRRTCFRRHERSENRNRQCQSKKRKAIRQTVVKKVY